MANLKCKYSKEYMETNDWPTRLLSKSMSKKQIKNILEGLTIPKTLANELYINTLWEQINKNLQA
ncbi:MAG: hypothetical protein AB8G05_06250 [Oligoflexales bacterium]